MRHCSRCHAPIESEAGSCRHCGDEAVTDPDFGVELIAAYESPPAQLQSPAEASPASSDAAGAGDSQPPTYSPWSFAMVGGVGAIVGVLAMAALMWLQPQTPAQPVGAGQPQSARSDASVVVEPAERPTWVGRRQAAWASDGSKTIEFELQATSDVPVWMAKVRPSLVVRCVSRSTEVFVAIRSSASIEPQAGSHTVRLQIDDDPEVIQKWSDSVSSQELFAPNAVSLARRLAGAHRMRFGFTPYNAKPVMAEFSVQGFDKLAGLVASTCGWRLHDSGTPAPRSARLN